MAQTNENNKSEEAEERTRDTKRFVRQVRSATRRKYSFEEKIRIVLEGFRRGVTVNELCRREGIKPNSFYSWTKEFIEAVKQRPCPDTVRDATGQEIEQLKRDNADLKHLVAELSLDVFRLKKVAVPYPVSAAGTRG
jgi:transposase